MMPDVDQHSEPPQVGPIVGSAVKLSDLVQIRRWRPLDEVAGTSAPTLEDFIATVHDRLRSMDTSGATFVALKDLVVATQLDSTVHWAEEARLMFSSRTAFLEHFPDAKRILRLGHVRFSLTGSTAVHGREHARTDKKIECFRRPDFPTPEEWIVAKNVERRRDDPDESQAVPGPRNLLLVYREVWLEVTNRQREKPLYRPSLFHSTTSAALPGIHQFGALLSRTKLRERGLNPLSGEVADQSPRVYAASVFNYGAQYSSLRWFDEFPIVIELDAERCGDRREQFAPDHGISLGHEVPTSEFRAIYGPFDRRKDLEVWASRIRQEIKVGSIEAMLLSGC